MNTEKVFVFYDWNARRVAFMFRQPTKLSQAEIDWLRDEACRRMDGPAALEVVSG